MFEELPITIMCVLGLCALMFPRILQFESDWERGVLYAALLGHVLSAFAQSAYHHYVFRGGDAFDYVRVGHLYARLLRLDLGTYLPDLISYMLQGDARLPGVPDAAPNSTTSMAALTGLLLFFAPGDLTSTSVLFGGWSFFGLSCLFRVFREALPFVPRERAALAALGIPTVMFWSSCVTKEAVAVGGLGVLTFGLHRAAQGRLAPGIAAMAVGALSISIVKPYVLVAFGFSAAAYIFVHRARALDPTVQVVVRPAQFATAFALAIGIALGVGELSPRFAIDNLNREISRLQDPSMMYGGSAYSLGMERNLSFAQQLAYAPLALLTATLRPFIFETHNIPSFINGLETTLAAVLCAMSIAKQRLRDIGSAIMQEPILAFGATFVVTFGIGVGLATTNFGTLSRYRMPLMPFWAILLMIFSMSDAPERMKAFAGLHQRTA